MFPRKRRKAVTDEMHHGGDQGCGCASYVVARQWWPGGKWGVQPGGQHCFQMLCSCRGITGRGGGIWSSPCCSAAWLFEHYSKHITPHVDPLMTATVHIYEVGAEENVLSRQELGLWRCGMGCAPRCAPCCAPCGAPCCAPSCAPCCRYRRPCWLRWMAGSVCCMWRFGVRVFAGPCY